MLISKDDIIQHLMSVVPRVQFLVQRTVSQLRGVCVHVCERQARHSVRERVCVKGVRHVGIAMLHTVHCVEHATNQEAVTVATVPKTRAEAPYWLQVSGAEVDEQHYFLVEALCVQSRVEHPQARLIHSKLHFSLCPVNLLVQYGVMQRGPGSYISVSQVISDDVPAEGAVVEESSVKHNVACSSVTVGQLV